MVIEYSTRARPCQRPAHRNSSSHASVGRALQWWQLIIRANVLYEDLWDLPSDYEEEAVGSILKH